MTCILSISMDTHSKYWEWELLLISILQLLTQPS
nr:unnamed protein product [Callosobruchus chinensis]